MSREELAEKKPFLGVPLSTKDCISVKGLLNTGGLYHRKNYRAPEDSVVIGKMRAAGAIPFCLTNISELCMWYESNNTIHGRTNNPYDTFRIVGAGIVKKKFPHGTILFFAQQAFLQENS